MSDAFRIEVRESGVAWVVLTRAEKHNAFDDQLIAALAKAFAELDSTQGLCAVVLAAEGPSFSAGADLAWMQRAATQTRAANLADARQLSRLLRTLDELSKPTLALVQGPAYGGAIGLIACCDIAIAADSAKFALSETRLGLIPAVIGPYVVAAIGARVARRYFQTAEVFDAAEAARIGLLHEVMPAGRLEHRAHELLTQLAQSAPGARAAAKRLVAEVAFKRMDDALAELTVQRLTDIRTGQEATERLSAFLNRPKRGRA